MQPLVTLFFNYFLAGNYWGFVGIFPGTKGPHFPSRTVSQTHNDRPHMGMNLFVGEAFRLPQTGRETRPLRWQRTEGFVIARPIGPWRPSASREEVPLGCNLPVQFTTT